jgi:DUF4097 and DUF4098 domain-containing protein YvlB
LVVYQDRRGPEQTERLSRRIRIGANGRLTLANVAGEIVVTGGSGDEVVVEAVKRTRGDRDDLASVEIDIEERPGRVEVRTRHTGRRDRTAVDFTVSVPAGTEVDVSSVSGSVRVSSVRGTVRARSVSGNVTTAGSPRVEVANSVSGDVDLADVSSDGDLNVGSVSGDIRARGVKARALDLSTVSGRIDAADVTCDRLRMKSVSGDLDFTGTLARNGRYEVNSHSGDVRMAVPENSGFELDATTFSGSIDSELPAKLTGASSSDDRRRRGRTGRTTRAVVGDGTAVLTIATFSGDILIRRR